MSNDMQSDPQRLVATIEVPTDGQILIYQLLPPETQEQLNRIEAKLDKLLRLQIEKKGFSNGIEPDLYEHTND